MDDKFTFVYPVTQKSRKHMADVFGEGHILYQGSWMCGKRMVKDKSHKYATKTQRIEGSKVCLSCQKKYKENLDSDWSKWIVAITQDLSRIEVEDSPQIEVGMDS